MCMPRGGSQGIGAGFLFLQPEIERNTHNSSGSSNKFIVHFGRETSADTAGRAPAAESRNQTSKGHSANRAVLERKR